MGKIPHSFLVGDGFKFKLSGKELRIDHMADHSRAPVSHRNCMLSLNVASPVAMDFDENGDLYVVEVMPVEGSSQLLVQVSIPPNVAVVDVLERLERTAPRLRAAVAAAITRKRAPELTFVPVARTEVLP